MTRSARRRARRSFAGRRTDPAASGSRSGPRALLGWRQADLAAKAGFSPASLVSIETGKSDPKVSTMKRLQQALEDAGIVFINGDAPGVRLRLASSA